MHLGVMGAGSIGCYVGGKLLATGATEVVLVGRARIGSEIAAHGLTVKDFDHDPVSMSADQVAFAADVAALADCDVVLCCVKSAQTEEVARAMAGVLRADTLVVSLQNGVRNADVLAAQLGKQRVVPGIVGFNVVARGRGMFHRATSLPLMLARSQAPHAESLYDAFRRSGLSLELRDDLAPDQWTKLLVNLNNAVSALSNAPTRELLLTPAYRRIIAAIVEEALSVLRAASIRPAKLRGVPVGWMPRVLRLPTPLVRLVTRAQMRVDPEARSSMWEDLERRRETEIDYLNGEIVRLAERVGADAPINRRIVELVRRAEQASAGSPKIAADELWHELAPDG